tara:strand:+ start:5218 stop:6345 length:1128 start_codon:yes stop_codon:yes gene_type:complete
MHPVEKFQSYFRLGINKPHLEETYLPTPYSKYVLIFNDSFIQANEYSYFTDVVEYLHSADPNLNLVQVVNSPNSELLPNTYHISDLSHNHLYFLIKNALVVISSEQFCSEVCGVYDTPLVRISGNSLEGNVRPFFSKEGMHSVFCAEDQPSFAGVENVKTINKILPEDIARIALKKLNIKDPTPLYKTLYVGSLYRQYMVDYVPDFILEGNVSGTQPVTARLDIDNSFTNVLHAASHTNISSICLNKEVDVENLVPLKNNVQSIVVEVSLDLSVDFIKEIHKLGCEIMLYTHDSENLNALKLKFIDWVVRFIEVKEKMDLPKSKQLYYKSTKLTLSKNKKFTSLAARNVNDDSNKVLDNKTFWKESEHFLIYSLD